MTVFTALVIDFTKKFTSLLPILSPYPYLKKVFNGYVHPQYRIGWTPYISKSMMQLDQNWVDGCGACCYLWHHSYLLKSRCEARIGAAPPLDKKYVQSSVVVWFFLGWCIGSIVVWPSACNKLHLVWIWGESLLFFVCVFTREWWVNTS